MLALVRPDSWNLPLFLHVFGAMVLTGALAATVVAAGRSDASLLLRRVAFRTLLALVLPAWILMRVTGQWTDSREPVGDGSTWLDIGYIVGDAGVLFLLVATIVAWWGVRRPGQRWPARAVAVLATVYLAALLVTMWAMTAKPD